MRIENQILPGLLEILENYLSGNQLNELFKSISCLKHDEPEKLEVKNNNNNMKNNSADMEIRDDIRKQVDGIVTYAERKLPKEKHLMLLNNLGKMTVERGEYDLAKDVYSKILKFALKNTRLENIAAYSLFSLGDIYNRQAQWKKSLHNIDKAYKLFKKQRDLKGMAKCENLIGAIHLGQGKISLSNKHFEKALSHLSFRRDKSVLAMMEGNIGTVKSIQGNFDLAYTFYRRALLKFEEAGNLKRVAEIRHNLGILLTQKKQYDLALSEFDICLRISLNINYLSTQGISFLGKAYIYALKDNLDLAATYADRAMKISHLLNDSLTSAEVYKVFGIIERKKKNYLVSENHFLTSLRINKELENELNYAETAFELGVLYNEAGREKDASSYFRKAINYYKKIKADSEITRIKLFIAGRNNNKVHQ